MGLVSSPKHKGLLGNPSMEKPNMEKNIQIVDLDESGEFRFPPTSGKGTTKNDAISVEEYCEERDLELAIRASLLPSQNFIDLDSYDDDLSVLNFKPDINPRPRKKPFVYPSVTERGESSNSKSTAAPASPPPPPFVCEICAEPKSQNESFKINGCSHYYCTDCVAKFITTRLQENITAIYCPVPNCSGLLEPEYCRRILAPEVFNRWGDALCEEVILGSQKFYCPYKNCSALLIMDDGLQQVRESICPYCFRLFCAQCKVPWHSEIQCEEFQKLHKDEREREDIMLLKLAQQKMWARCPKCRSVVEKTRGCDNIYCRCGTSFRYDTQRCKGEQGRKWKKLQVH